MEKMSIADLLKYAEYLEKRGEEIGRKMRQLEAVKTITRIVSQATTQNVEEVSSPSMSVKEFSSEFDANFKELRLVRQTIEKLNHSTLVEFNTKF